MLNFLETKHLSLGFVLLLSTLCAKGQQVLHTEKDSIKQKELNEVVIIGRLDISQKQNKTLATLDSYLESNSSINMLRRGAYAWEPMLNGMSSERSLVTIDGMRIYGACTDKMDPITSYVEITNLSRAQIQNGQSGAQHGATIAGSIDLQQSHATFDRRGFGGLLFSGFEGNNRQKILGTKLQLAEKDFYSDFSFTLRDAKNYRAGGNLDVPYSQFTKYNLSANAGWKTGQDQHIAAAVIYDLAKDVGYPGLPMDVASAEALITSIAYQRQHLSSHIHKWESKLYYNQVTHIMDDSQRPFVPVRMDMPGWSKTLGFYSLLQGNFNEQQWKLNWTGHYNYSMAEMTMFANTPGQADMFMLTWPGVNSYVSNLYLENQFPLGLNWQAKISAASGFSLQTVGSEFGFESLKIFYPHMSQRKTHWLNSLSANLSHQQGRFINQLGLSYGERAASVSEAYGFYLFNSMDSYDYVGNPNMQKERSLLIHASSLANLGQGFVKLQASYFSIYDYIIGRPQVGLLPMTIGALGIKRYENAGRADILNLGFTAEQALSNVLHLKTGLQYRYGSLKGENLPQIQPLAYNLGLKYGNASFSAEASMEGASKQSRYSPNFGESPAAAYTVFHLALSKAIKLGSQRITLKTGVENLFDRKYRTFADWNKIPRMGRNIYLNTVFNF